jgi:CheY-like chemotaxis protein
MKILYLEDNAQDAIFVKRYLDVTEHELELVSSIKEAESRCDSSVDLFLMDVMINNERSGLDFMKKLRQAGFNQPTVAVTALSSSSDIESCRRAGFNAVLVKPYTIQHLAEIIDEVQSL